MRIVFAWAAVLSFAGATLAGDEAKCPVSGKPIDKSVSIDYEGAKLYFCCDGCPDGFAAKKEKLAAKANLQLVQTKQAVQVGCPMSGEACGDATETVEGVKVCFCCENCSGSVAKAEDKVESAFGEKAFAKGFTTQTKCPVSGKQIDATKTAEHQGKKVYFCCGGCPDVFEREPEKFAKSLPQFAPTK